MEQVARTTCTCDITELMCSILENEFNLASTQIVTWDKVGSGVKPLNAGQHKLRAHERQEIIVGPKHPTAK